MHMRPLLAAVVLLICGCARDGLVSYDSRVHDDWQTAGEIFRATDRDDPLAYFYGIHYSAASCGLSPRYDRKTRDVLVPLFCACLRNPQCVDYSARAAICRYLGFSGDRRAVPTLIEALEGDLCTNVAEALGRIGDPRAVGPLRRLAESGRGGRDVIYALASIRTREAVHCLAGVLASSPDAVLREEAAIALGWTTGHDRIGKAAGRALERAFMNDASGRVRVFCAAALVEAGRDILWPYVREMAYSGDPEVWDAAAECVSFRITLTARSMPVVIDVLRRGSRSALESPEKHFAGPGVSWCTEDGKQRTMGEIADEYQKQWKDLCASGGWPCD